MTDVPTIDITGWRKAMEGVTPGWHRDKFGFLRDGEGFEVIFRQMTTLSAGPDKNMAQAKANQRFADHCTPQAITALLDALEASMAREAAAEARVTALEAEKAGAIKLADGYGIVLMMIAAGCSDPQRFAKRMLAEYEAEAKKMEPTK